MALACFAIVVPNPFPSFTMPKHTTPDHARLDRVVAEARKQRELREAGYREKALKLYPHICTRCGREFSGARLRELTVHHKDHNHDNNPPDGSNWELLCIYCHENEHARMQVAGEYAEDETGGAPQQPASTYKPFADLGDLLKNRK